jgi:MoxR-like ATPase
MFAPKPEVLMPERQRRLEAMISAIGTVILGKERVVRLALACLLARGHLLIQDIPGMGKTTLARAFARVLGLQFQRIQFTSDLLPADVLGSAVYESQQGRFTFHPGPIFAQLIVADEINRATPKTQSALLEAMEENQVTIEGETRKLPQPFFVIATQNPTTQMGTFPLPESQLDRFLMCIELGYPDAQAERALLQGQDRRGLLAKLPVCLTPPQVMELQSTLASVHLASGLLDYLQAILAFSRHSKWLQGGLSPRAGMALLRATRAWALLSHRDFVLPEDIQAVLPSVVGHRLQPADEHLDDSPAELARHLIASVSLPS